VLKKIAAEHHIQTLGLQRPGLTAILMYERHTGFQPLGHGWIQIHGHALRCHDIVDELSPARADIQYPRVLRYVALKKLSTQDFPNTISIVGGGSKSIFVG
jgi:hypothetical protein